MEVARNSQANPFLVVVGGDRREGSQGEQFTAASRQPRGRFAENIDAHTSVWKGVGGANLVQLLPQTGSVQIVLQTQESRRLAKALQVVIQPQKFIVLEGAEGGIDAKGQVLR